LRRFTTLSLSHKSLVPGWVTLDGVWAVFIFLGGIIIHYRSHRSFFELLYRFSVLVLGCVCHQKADARISSFTSLSPPRILVVSALAACTSLFSSTLADTPGDGCCHPLLLNVTDSNNLVWISVYFFPFCRCRYYNTPPIYRLEGKGWMGHSWSSPSLPRAALCRNHGCLYFLCRRYRHHTLHTSLGTYSFCWMEGMEEERKRSFVGISILLFFYLFHSTHIVTTHLHLHMFYLPSLHTYRPQPPCGRDQSNHCHRCSVPMDGTIIVPLPCVNQDVELRNT
jgi:hypothetical protein